MEPNLTPKEVYQKLYRITNHILKDLNPCQFEIDDKGVATCIRNREWGDFDVPSPIGPTWHAASNGCCTGCKHLGPQGCTIDNLGCKVFTCGYLSESKGDARVAYISLREVRYAAFNKAPALPPDLWKSSDELFDEAGEARGRG